MVKSNKLLLLLAVLLSALAYACTSDVPETGSAERQGLIAIASGTPLFGTAPLSVSFNAGESVDPEGGTLSYSWDFDDSSFSAEVASEHTFDAVGTYMVTLTVTDSSGRDDAAWVVIIAH